MLYIELIALGSYKSADIEPMNVIRVAIMKNASRRVLVYNPSSGSLTPFEADKDITDRLIQVGRILNIDPIDHLIINPKSYISFRKTKLMDELEQSLKYVPTYQVIDMIRKEEKKIAKEKLAVEKDKTKTAQQKAKAEKEPREKLELATAIALRGKGLSIEDIAKILDISERKVNQI
ncbi:DNA repair protein [Gilliamella sp. ESL0405]|nr:DNA repair protein [Gilliamella sp. ESL0405]